MATNLVITGQAGAQIMGDWAQGEFSVAEQVEGKDYSCLPGLGLNPVIDTGGDAFYFPVNDDPAITAAQKELAALLISPEVQVSFNLAKGSRQCVVISTCPQQTAVCKRASRSLQTVACCHLVISRSLRTRPFRLKICRRSSGLAICLQRMLRRHTLTSSQTRTSILSVIDGSAACSPSRWISIPL